MDYSSSHHYSLSTSQISAINVAGGANSAITQNNSINTSSATNVAAAAAASVASTNAAAGAQIPPPPFQLGGSASSTGSLPSAQIAAASSSLSHQQPSTAQSHLSSITPSDHTSADLLINDFTSLSHIPQGPPSQLNSLSSKGAGSNTVCTVTPATGSSQSIKSEYHPNVTLASLTAPRSSIGGTGSNSGLAGSYLGQCFGTDYYNQCASSHTPVVSQSNNSNNPNSNFHNYSFYSLSQNSFGVNGSSPSSTASAAATGYHGHPHNAPPQHVTPSAFLSNVDATNAAAVVTSHAYPKPGSFEFNHAANVAASGADLFYPSSNSLFHAATGYLFPNATHGQQYYYTPTMQSNCHGAYPNANVLTNYMSRSSLNGTSHHQTPTAVNINVSCNIAGNGSSSISPEEHSSQQTTPQGLNSTEHTTSPVAKCNTLSASGYDFLDDPKQGFASLCNNNAIFANHDQLSPPHEGYNALQVTDTDMMKGNPHAYGSAMHETRKFGVAHSHLLRSSPGSLTDSKTSPIDSHLTHTLNGNSGALSNAAGVNLPYSWMKIKRNQSHLQCKFSNSIFFI